MQLMGFITRQIPSKLLAVSD
jgi:hypothetical protein